MMLENIDYSTNTFQKTAVKAFQEELACRILRDTVQQFLLLITVLVQKWNQISG